MGGAPGCRVGGTSPHQTCVGHDATYPRQLPRAPKALGINENGGGISSPVTPTGTTVVVHVELEANPGLDLAGHLSDPVSSRMGGVLVSATLAATAC